MSRPTAVSRRKQGNHSRETITSYVAQTGSRPTAGGTIPDDGPKTQTGQGMDRDKTHLPESPFVIRLSFEISIPSIR
jgi:hypothetical protein